MPAHRVNSTPRGRGEGKDAAGNTLANWEQIESWCIKAKAVGVDLNVSDWYREGITELHRLRAQKPTADDIAAMESVIEAMQRGFVRDYREERPDLIPVGMLRLKKLQAANRQLMGYDDD